MTMNMSMTTPRGGRVYTCNLVRWRLVRAEGTPLRSRAITNVCLRQPEAGGENQHVYLIYISIHTTCKMYLHSYAYYSSSSTSDSEVILHGPTIESKL